MFCLVSIKLLTTCICFDRHNRDQMTPCSFVNFNRWSLLAMANTSVVQRKFSAVNAKLCASCCQIITHNITKLIDTEKLWEFRVKTSRCILKFIYLNFERCDERWVNRFNFFCKLIILFSYVSLSFEVSVIDMLDQLLKIQIFYNKITPRGVVHLLLDLIEKSSGRTLSGWFNILNDSLKTGNFIAFCFLFTWSGKHFHEYFSLFFNKFSTGSHKLKLKIALIWKKIKSQRHTFKVAQEKYNFVNCKNKTTLLNHKLIKIEMDFYLNSVYTQGFIDEKFGFHRIPVEKVIKNLQYNEQLTNAHKEEVKLLEFYETIRNSKVSNHFQRIEELHHLSKIHEKIYPTHPRVQ